jgi:hypothetical protein
MCREALKQDRVWIKCGDLGTRHTPQMAESRLKSRGYPRLLEVDEKSARKAAVSMVHRKSLILKELFTVKFSKC